jgi:hypothetical protein
MLRNQKEFMQPLFNNRIEFNIVSSIIKNGIETDMITGEEYETEEYLSQNVIIRGIIVIDLEDEIFEACDNNTTLPRQDWTVISRITGKQITVAHPLDYVKSKYDRYSNEMQSYIANRLDQNNDRK